MSNYEKSGKVFIAYKGNEFDESELVRKLRTTYVSSYTVKTLCRSDSDVIFAKVVYDNYVSDRDMIKMKFLVLIVIIIDTVLMIVISIMF